MAFDARELAAIFCGGVVGALARTGLGDALPREGIGVGFLGGFTTFSTFSVQAVLEADAGRGGRALAYVVVSVVGGIAAAALGYALGRKAV